MMCVFNFVTMRYARLTLAVLVLVSCFHIARSQDVIYSPFDKFDFRNGDYAVVGMTGGSVFTYRNTGDDAMLDAFDDSMNKTATIILDFFPTKIYQTRFIACSDRILILYQALESNKVVQYAALLDQKGRLKNKPLELGHIKTSIFGAMKTYFYSAVSEDKKKLLIYTLNDKVDGVEMDCKWLDDSLKVIKKAKAVFPSNTKLTKGEVNIANDGTVYMAAYTTAGVQNYADDYMILSLPEGETKFKANYMNLHGKYAASGYMKIDNTNQTIYFGGFYTDRKNGNYNGIIYAAMNRNEDSFSNLKFIPFDEALISEASEKHHNHPFDNYVPMQVIAKNDGGFVMIAEDSYITTRTNYMPTVGYYSAFYTPYNTSLVREYHYNDIMALSYNKDGVREWKSFIHKEQYSQEDGGAFGSYALLNSGGSLAFLFNDFNSTRSRIQLATVDPVGKTDVSSFTPIGNNSPDWLPRAGKQVASRVLIVPCLLKKQICFARVDF